MAEETQKVKDDTYDRYKDLVLELNLDGDTADQAWKSYETLKLRYTMEVRYCLVSSFKYNYKIIKQLIWLSSSLLDR